MQVYQSLHGFDLSIEVIFDLSTFQSVVCFADLRTCISG